MRLIGTKAMGVRAPIVKEGDNLVDIVIQCVLDAQIRDGFEFKDRDIVGITESLVARAQGNYCTVDHIVKDLCSKFEDEITVVFPILSRNRFSIIMKAIAATGKKIKIFLSYPCDEVGNGLIDKYLLMDAGINIYKDTLTEKNYREIAQDTAIHPFTGMDYIELYRSMAVDDNIEVFLSNNLEDIAANSKEILVANIHERNFLKGYFLKSGIKNTYSLQDIMNSSIDGSGYNKEFGLYGSNLSSDNSVKLFPRDAQLFAETVQKHLVSQTNRQIDVLVYGDGAFKDPVGGIWELADPVVSPGFTNGLLGQPNELKLKYIADTELDGIDGQEAIIAIKNRISDKDSNLTGHNSSLGTTPRRLIDLIGSLCDLTSGSGDKGTPIIYIQGYFDNYASD